MFLNIKKVTVNTKFLPYFLCYCLIGLNIYKALCFISLLLFLSVYKVPESNGGLFLCSFFSSFIIDDCLMVYFQSEKIKTHPMLI